MIFNIIDRAIDLKASDIHITYGLPPIVRIDGSLKKLNEFNLNDDFFLKELKKQLLDEFLLDKYKKYKNVDLSMSYKNIRLRIHVYKQRGHNTFSLRIIPKEVPLLKDVNLPEVLRKFTCMKNGLVLVTGVTGSGKSTTLASLINEINIEQSKHIITVEDPIEYLHSHKQSIVNQREVGSDVLTFSQAVIAAMREDPDILLIGELRDLDTIRNAITMAETGHLVFSTLHTRSVSESIDRIIDVFPAGQQDQIRIQLSNSIEGIISQELLPMIDGGRVPCCEIMFVNNAIRNLIREKASPSAILDQIYMNNKKLGSQTKVQALKELIEKGQITKEFAFEGLSDNDRDTLERVVN